MLQTVFRGDELPAGDRLARFDEFQVNSVHPMRVLSDAPERFTATARAADLADVNVVELACSPSIVRRTPQLVRAADPELCSLVFARRGRLGVVQAGREATLSGRDFAVYDSSQPFRLALAGGSGSVDGRAAADDGPELVRVHVPHSSLPLPPDAVRRLLAVRLPGREGVGALLTQFFTGLVTGPADYRPTDVRRLGTVALDLLTAALAHHLDAEPDVPAESRQRALLLRIEAFVRRHLHDPELSPGTIAAAHHISVSHLHRLFRGRETTVAAWVRRQRLEGASGDLGDPALRGVPVHRIGARWGFHDHATFTRAFRAAYGVPPKDYRQHALSRSAQPPPDRLTASGQ